MDEVFVTTLTFSTFRFIVDGCEFKIWWSSTSPIEVSCCELELGRAARSGVSDKIYC